MTTCGILFSLILIQACMGSLERENVIQLTAEIESIDESGRRVNTFIRYIDLGVGVGQDGVYGTEDDGVSEYTVTSYDDLESVSTRYYGQGVDGIWFTADDSSDESERLALDPIYEKDNLLISVKNYGKDGLPKTIDDEFLSYTKTLSNGNDKTVITYDASGDDSLWMTDDDVVSAYVVSTYTDSDLLLEVKYFEVGDDGVWFSDDDLIYRIETYEYDSSNLPSKIEEVYLNSTLLDLAGADISNRWVYEFEVKILTEELLEITTVQKSPTSNHSFYDVYTDNMYVERYELTSDEDLMFSVLYRVQNYNDTLNYLREFSDNGPLPRLSVNRKLLSAKLIGGGYNSNFNGSEVTYTFFMQGMRYIDKTSEDGIYRKVEYYNADAYTQTFNDVELESGPVFVDLTALDLFSINEKELENYQVDRVVSNEITNMGDGVSKNVYRDLHNDWDDENYPSYLREKSTHIVIDKTQSNSQGAN